MLFVFLRVCAVESFSHSNFLESMYFACGETPRPRHTKVIAISRFPMELVLILIFAWAVGRASYSKPGKTQDILATCNPWNNIGVWIGWRKYTTDHQIPTIQQESLRPSNRLPPMARAQRLEIVATEVVDCRRCLMSALCCVSSPSIFAAEASLCNRTFIPIKRMWRRVWS